MSTERTAIRKVGPAPIEYPKDAPQYLIQKGWRHEGDPYHPHTLWLDPTKPDVETQEWRVVGKRVPSNVADMTLEEAERRGVAVEIKQLVITPRVFGVRVVEAVALQMDRDRQEAEKR